MFVDASALVAILTEEPEAQRFTDDIEAAGNAITSPVTIFEALAALRRKKLGPGEALVSDLRSFMTRARIAVVPVQEEVGYAAAEAQARYGKGSGHPARLNLGDCFAYAMARHHGVPLLYKGDDFARTDLA